MAFRTTPTNRTQEQMAKHHRKNLNSKVSVGEGVQSIRRTISLIQEIAKNNHQGIRLSVLSKMVKIPVATVHRILSVLTSERIIEHDSISKRYRLGFELYSLANKPYQLTVRDKYRTCLEHVAEKSQGSAYLLMRSGNDSICVDCIDAKFPIRVVYDVGTRRPLGMGTAGLTLLSFLDKEDIERVIKANSPRYAEYSRNLMAYEDYNKVTQTEIRIAIERVRKLGYFFNEAMFLKNINGVGVPIFSSKGQPLGAISVTAPAGRISQTNSKEIAELIKSEIYLVR